MATKKLPQSLVDAAARSGWILVEINAEDCCLERYSPAKMLHSYFLDMTKSESVGQQIIGICQYYDDAEHVKELIAKATPKMIDNPTYIREMYRELGNAVAYAMKTEEKKLTSKDIKSFKRSFSEKTKKALSKTKTAKKPAVRRKVKK